MKKFSARTAAKGGFTLLEVALIVAIIGMMLLMIIGYLMAPKQSGPLPPVPERSQIQEGPSAAPAARPVPPPVPAAAATPAPLVTPAATPAQTIEITPQSAPTFR